MAFSKVPITRAWKKGRAAGKRAAKKARGGRVPAKKATTALIKRVLKGELETKYVASQEKLAGMPLIGSITPATNAQSCLPPLLLQTAAAESNRREGDSVMPIRASIKGHIWFDNIDPPVGLVVFVKLFFVQPKSIKNFALAATTLPVGLLEDGTINPVQWTAAGQDLQAFYPVASSNYTLLKTKTFKLVRNGGYPIGNQPGHDTNLGRDRYTFSYNWVPPKLKYAVDTDQYPSNHAPIMFAVAYSPGYNYDTDPSLTGRVLMNWQTSMSYKDA